MPTLRPRGCMSAGAFIAACRAAARAAATRCRAAAAARRRSDGCGRAGTARCVSPKPSKKNGTSGTLRAAATVGEQRVELARVGGPVVRRQPHAHEQHLGAVALPPPPPSRRDSSRVALRSPPRRPSLPPSSMTTMPGRCCASSVGSRARPPAVVSPLMLALITRCAIAALLEPRGEQIDPAGAGGQAVGGGNRVADDEQRRRLVLRERRQRRSRPRGARTARRRRESGGGMAWGAFDGGEPRL